MELEELKELVADEWGYTKDNYGYRVYGAEGDAIIKFCYELLTNNNNKSYDKTISYTFELCGEILEIFVHDDTCVEVRETRCNGQEDAHMSGILEKVNGKWKWCEDEGGGSMFEEYHSKKLMNAIPKYINKHGLPI